VMNVALRFAFEYGLGKQGLLPQCDQTAWVEIFRMQTPEPHSRYFLTVVQPKTDTENDARVRSFEVYMLMAS
ncbi:MAG: hypothetical protein LOY00_11430, partial [Methylocaldum sp.]|nr:hypothetical protein [Methylocaldum sp.]